LAKYFRSVFNNLVHQTPLHRNDRLLALNQERNCERLKPASGIQPASGDLSRKRDSTRKRGFNPQTGFEPPTGLSRISRRPVFFGKEQKYMIEQKIENAPTPEADGNDPQPEESKPAPKRVSCRGCNLWDEVKERVRITELLENAIEKMGDKLKAQEFKPSLADYLKLMQLEKEFDQEQVKEIKVTWVAPAPSSEK
jgi:hypothetical protein